MSRHCIYHPQASLHYIIVLVIYGYPIGKVVNSPSCPISLGPAVFRWFCMLYLPWTLTYILDGHSSYHTHLVFVALLLKCTFSLDPL